ncbi:hypothetical protein [Picosynechococcus sp. PCC 73109]|uniref:hypothetical protein n=1 Tax=Picosynechococcus sp. PCC 73109 TaxID=374982 RepID=UPI0007458A2F|nr:hypothetical protein [Picosynechococcus sp. PCC 73109]AMA09846.1 hypothetical protein AWQ23_11230 [Picosynechococcus sp. PCC 73109]
MPFPSQWKQFCEWNKINNKNIPDYINLSEINRFAARYRLASGFKGLDVEGFRQESTVNGYSATFKVFLAYTALEQLHKATRSNPQHLHERFGESQPILAAKLRDFSNILNFLREQLASEKLKKELQNFIDEKHDVCLYVATGLRHAFSHGFMSVHANNTTPQQTIEFCEVLSTMLLELANREFSEITDSLCENSVE